MAKKLNSIRLLDSHGIAYEVLYFPDSIHSAQGVAEHVGVPAAQVYKTLVLMNARHKPLLVLVAADQEVRVKQVAQAVGEKKLRMATHKEAEAVTGLRVGGISALALLHKGFPVYIDQQATYLDTILLSAGQRGINLRLPVNDFLRVTGATAIAATAPSASEYDDA
jgi:Cys-tRNA(Pro)/Cys-tRNA(Cys) deacylase